MKKVVIGVLSIVLSMFMKMVSYSGLKDLKLKRWWPHGNNRRLAGFSWVLHLPNQWPGRTGHRNGCGFRPRSRGIPRFHRMDRPGCCGPHRDTGFSGQYSFQFLLPPLGQFADIDVQVVVITVIEHIVDDIIDHIPISPGQAAPKAIRDAHGLRHSCTNLRRFFSIHLF